MNINFNQIDFEALNAIGQAALETAKSKGFNTNEVGAEIDQKLLLMVGEIVEAQEELRSGHTPVEIYYPALGGKPEGFPIELADLIIRTLQLAASQGIDIARAVEMKMRFNETRPEKHGRQF